MARNRNNDIEVIAGLNVTASYEQIQRDLDHYVTPRLKLKISCSIDESSLKSIQSQLNKIKKGLTLDLGGDKVKDNLTNQAKKIEQSLGLAYPRGETEKLRNELKKLISEYTKAYDAEGGWGEQAQQNMTELIRFANSYRKEIQLINDDLKDTQDEIKRIKKEQQQLYITTDQFNALERHARDDGTTPKAMLDRALGVGRWSSDINTYKYKKPYYWSNFAEEVNQINPLKDALIDEGDIIQGIKDLTEFMDKSFIHIDNTLEKNEEAYLKWGNSVIETINSVTGRNPFADEYVEINADDDFQNINKIVSSLDMYDDAIEESAEQSEYWRKQQELLQQAYEKTAAKIKKASLNINEVATREEVTSGDVVNYNARFNEIMSNGITDAKTFKEARDTLSAINNEFQILNAQMVSDLPQNVIENLVQRIHKADSEIQVLTVDYKKLNNPSQELIQSFEKLKSLTENFDFSADFGNETKEGIDQKTKDFAQIKVALNDAKSALTAFQKAEKEADAFARKLDEHNKEIQKRLDLREQEIQKAKELNEAEMHNYWQERFEESVKGMTAENAGLKALKEQLLGYNKAAKEAEIQQKKAFQEDNRLANLQNRISRLTADVNKYASANQRATNSMKQMSNGKTFAIEWSRITKEMAKGTDLTDRELKDLAADMAVFRKEAQAAGLAGDSAFGKFLKSFKVMSSYITANMVFNFVKRQIRELVNEVTEVDTAMTELRKVTEATNDEFAEFARSAGQTGRELGASVSDVINATAEFARLGESLPDAEELGRVATLYKNVGDGIDITTASEDIVSTMKAFKIEAKDAITIVDKLNEVGNNFAISSGGIGEALKRSASALAAANNDLSESIALITTANTIAQDPTTVGQGIKTVSLRLRSTKTEIEEMGEDAEGAAENISKLRDQMLSLTGVDIQLDNNTYKSTYQILLEISKVWSRLDDLSRASVLEQLFGKRQANIGAAILENGELLEQVYKKSEGSMGSAMREQEEYAKSIQYSIDTLKAAYQDFADTVINNKFIKSLLGTAQSFLEVLTKIIDKFGVLPTIIASLSAPAISQIFNSFKEIKQIANYDFGKLYKIYEINLNNFKGFSAQEIQSLQKYVDLLKDGAVSTKEFNNIFADSRKEVTDAAKGFEKLNKSLHYGVISQEEYDQATQDLALSQKTATATSKALSLALKAIASVAIMVAINLAIKGISTLVDKLVVTKEELNEIREVSIENIQELSKSIDDLVSKEEKVANLLKRYQEIVSSTDDLSKSKDELLTIQNNIVEQFGAEKNSLDLLNDSYDVAIEKVKKLSDEEYARWKRNNAAKISELNDINSLDVKFTGKVVAGDEITSLDLDASNPNRYSSRLNELYESYYVIKDVDKEITEISKTVKGIGVAYSGWLKDSLSLSGDIREAYDQLGNLIDAVEASGSGASVEALSKRYEELGNVIQEIDNYIQKQTEHELAYNNLVSNTSIDNLKLILTAMGDLRSKWFDNLKDMQEESENTVGKISDALQSMVDGEALSSKDFWGLMELDTKHILTDIQMVGDKFVLNQEQLIALKDQYIDKQVESIELQNEEIEKQKEQLINAIAQAKAELAILGAKGLAKEASDVQKFIQQAERALLELENQQRRNNALIDQTNSKLGDTANYLNKLKKELDQLNNELDDYVSAFEYRIDRNINGLQAELDVLNEQKDVMQEELDVLYEQRDAIQETIDNYKTVADLVQDVVEKRKEELEAEKKAIEDTYNERINKLKEETEQREDAFEYAQKLANLENAKNNKRRVYDEARGWRYESVKEDVVKAENDLAKFENEREIKSLEKERDELTKTIDEQIKEQTEYAKFYKDTIDEIIIKEKELLAEQILGSNWRVEIANLDMTTAEKFRTEYNSHNTALQNITRTEIKLKEAAIKAKDAEIKSKEEQIKAWQKYKTDVQNAVKEVKTAQEGYMTVVQQLDRDEPLSLDNRGTAFETFRNRVVNAIGTITSKQAEIDNLTSSLDGLGGDYGFNFEIEGLDDLEKATYLAERLAVATSLANGTFRPTDISSIVTAMSLGYNDADLVNSWITQLLRGSMSNGGVADSTGIYMLHGTKNKSETVLNANDSAKLYEYVHNTPNLMADALTQANKLAGFKIAKNENTNNNSINVNIGAIYANNPTELTQGLDKTLDRYFKTKLTQSYTSRQ